MKAYDRLPRMLTRNAARMARLDVDVDHQSGHRAPGAGVLKSVPEDLKSPGAPHPDGAIELGRAQA